MARQLMRTVVRGKEILMQGGKEVKERNCKVGDKVFDGPKLLYEVKERRVLKLVGSELVESGLDERDDDCFVVVGKYYHGGDKNA